MYIICTLNVNLYVVQCILQLLILHCIAIAYNMLCSIYYILRSVYYTERNMHMYIYIIYINVYIYIICNL